MKRMKILLLTNSFPYPPTDGLKIKVYNLVRQLSKKHDLYIQSFYETPSEIEEQNVLHMRQFCRNIIFEPKKNQMSLPARVLGNMFGREPSFVKDFRSDNFEHSLNAAVKYLQPDIVHFDGINTIPYINNIAGRIPAVISPNDSLSLALKDSVFRFPMKSLHRKIYNLLQLFNVRRYEKQQYVRFQKCYVVSDVDKNHLYRLNRSIDAEAIPNGVDTNYFRPSGLAQDYPSLIYTANMGGGGTDYAVWFVRRVLPRIKSVLPDIKLYLVGKNPGRKLLNIAEQDKNIIVTGYVDDIRPYIERATVSVSPVMKSCGILNKVLEAMSMEKAVVGSNCSFYGIRHSRHQENMIAADNEEDFAGWIVHLIKNKNIRDNIGRNARQMIMGSYTWEKTAQRVELLYQQAIDKFHKPKPKNDLAGKRVSSPDIVHSTTGSIQ